MNERTRGKSAVTTVEWETDLDTVDWEAEVDAPVYDPALPEGEDDDAERAEDEAHPLEAADEGAPAAAVDDSLYPVAVLKIAMAMKRLGPAEARKVDLLMDEVLDGLVVDRADFKRYLDKNMGRLMAAVRSRGY